MNVKRPVGRVLSEVCALEALKDRPRNFAVISGERHFFYLLVTTGLLERIC